MRLWILLVLVALSLAGCKKDTDAPMGLVGTWQLVNRQCFCLRTPLPNETVVFTATEFSFFTDGQLTAHGTYATATAPWRCSGTTPVPVVLFTYATSTWPPEATDLTVTGNSLVIDHGGCLDAPVDTYTRRF